MPDMNYRQSFKIFNIRCSRYYIVIIRNEHGMNTGLLTGINYRFQIHIILKRECHNDLIEIILFKYISQIRQISQHLDTVNKAVFLK